MTIFISTIYVLGMIATITGMVFLGSMAEVGSTPKLQGCLTSILVVVFWPIAVPITFAWILGQVVKES